MLLRSTTTRALRRASRGLSSSSTRRADDYRPADPKSLNYSKLGFEYIPTRAMVVSDYDNSKWSAPRTQLDPYLRMHGLSNCLHYGQALFEGLKAFRTKNNEVMVFRWEENAKRMQRGCERLGMAPIPMELFKEVIFKAIEENASYIPPYGSGGSLYIRPFAFGNGAAIGLGKAPRFTFATIVVPVGNYYPNGVKPVKAVVLKDYDRAAPLGVGNVKAAGNYAPDVIPSAEAKSRGYTVVLYLDAKRHQFVEEFSTSNFVAVDESRKFFITPKSSSILGSVTNLSLQEIARSDLGMTVQIRPVKFSEVRTFSEVAACGTAVILTPISHVVDERGRRPRTIPIGQGTYDTMTALYDRIRAIQYGEVEDKFGWLTPVKGL